MVAVVAWLGRLILPNETEDVCSHAFTGAASITIVAPDSRMV